MSDTGILPASRLDDLIARLTERGYRTIGPVFRDGAIQYDRIAAARDLPVGWTDEQGPGVYRVKRRQDAAYFGFAVGPHSWKQYLFPSRQQLWSARRTDDGFVVEDNDAADEPAFAFLGVRACELAAIRVQDRVFAGADYRDPLYTKRREKALIVVVECGEPGEQCFCASMNTGPGVDEKGGFDLALTEVVGGAGTEHYFVCRAGSDTGREILASLELEPADDARREAARQRVADCASAMEREMPAGARETLAANPEHPRWEEVAERCLACANCTMVCPTCFCSTVDDVTELDGRTASRERRWDSCFTMDFSYIHGAHVRSSAKARYRQWLTHKLSRWHDQFDVSGCVGCGRCVTWCPSGIDLIEEVTAIGEAPVAGAATSGEES